MSCNRPRRSPLASPRFARTGTARQGFATAAAPGLCVAERPRRRYVNGWRSPCTFVYLCGLLLAPLICAISHAHAASETFAYESAVAYCRGNVTRPIALSDDLSILCFDGGIFDQDFSAVENLKKNGLFVVRSPGGDVKTAIALAGLLHDKNAIVVVYDYCVSACAHYLLIATDQTAVRKSTIVAWHFMRGLECSEMKSYGDGWPERLQVEVCPSVSWEQQRLYREDEALSLRFHTERTLVPRLFGGGFDTPQSIHVTKILKSMSNETGALPELLWMWNPRFYKAVFKTKVTYEAYPEGQAEVDEIAARIGYRRVIYDP